MPTTLEPLRPSVVASNNSAAPGSRAERRRQRPSPAGAPRGGWNASPWSWLASLKIGLVLLGMLTVASIIGTVIDPLERAQQVIYYSWWYLLLLLALAVNMSFSTWRTLQLKVLPSRRLRVQTSPAFFAESTPRGAVAYRGDIDHVAAAFRAQRCEVRVDGNAGVARAGWIALWGAPVSHVGLVAVLLAGFASAWVAKEGVVRIVEGGSVDTYQMRDGKQTIAPLGFTIALDDFSTGYFPKTRIPSHFESNITASSPAGEVLYRGMVEVNSSPEVHGWRLHQTSYEEMPRLARHRVSVTPPGAAQAIAVEVSLGQTIALPATDGATLTLAEAGGWSIRQGGATVATGSLASAHHGSSLALRAERFEPDFVLGADKQITSRSTEPNNPALQVTLLSDGAPALKQWLFGRADMKQFSHAGNDHFKLELVSTNFTGEKPVFSVAVADGHLGLALGTVELTLGEEKPVGETAVVEAVTATTDAKADWKVEIGDRVPAFATVLSLTSNPLIPVIYVACGVMMIGLVLGFFVRRREVWFLVDKDAGQLRVVAKYRHPAAELDAATQSILTRLATTAAVS